MSEAKATGDAVVASVIDGQWRVLERLGADGDTVHYKAESLKGGKLVSLKLLDERCARTRELVARFDREARTISRIDHPHCLAILAFGIHASRPYLVTEHVAGRRLSDELGTPQMTPARAARVARQILEGLRHGHAHGVIHRDLSPERILLVGGEGSQDHVKILDFGLARILGTDEKRRAGTPSYLAPEQANHRPVDHRADLYAVGVMLRALLAGGASPATISSSMQRLLVRATAVDPEQRFADANELLAALDSTVEGRAAVRRGASIQIPRVFGRAIAALVLLATLGSAGWWARTELARRRAIPPRPAAPSPPTAVVTPPAPPASALTRDVSPPPTAVVTPPAPTRAVSPPPTAVVTPPGPMRDVSPPPAPPIPPAPPVVAAPAPSAIQPKPPAPSGQQSRVEELISSGRLDEAEAELHALLANHGEQGELHLELGEIYFRRFWRRNALSEWDQALALDPALRRDPRITSRLCSVLGGRWNGAGAELIARRLGADALPALLACISSTADLERLQAAAQLAERIGGKGVVDPQLLARRTIDLSQAPKTTDAHRPASE